MGITRSGKTYTCKGIAEQLLDHGIPIVVFDAIGVWRHLKVPGDGPGAKGYPIVVAGGVDADLPLTPDGAPEIVRAAIRENIPLVIDLYDPKLSKADWRRIVQASMRTLLYENRGLRHIFLEEAAEYCPQRVMDGQTYAEVEKVVRMGGNVGLGITFINQRSQELNKAVLELCDNLFLLRQRGSHAIESLEKWMDRTSPDRAKEIAKSLPGMTQGECWVWTEANENPIRTKTAKLKSYHPDRRNISHDIGQEVKRKAVDTAAFVSKMSDDLKELLEKAKSEDPTYLQSRIAELESDLASAQTRDIPQNHTEIKVPVITDEQISLFATALERIETENSRLASVLDDFSKKATGLKDAAEFIRDLVAQAKGDASFTATGTSVGDYLAELHAAPATDAAMVRTFGGKPTANSSGDSKIDKCAKAILAVLFQNREGCTAGKLTLLAGYRYSGGFKNSLSSLRTAGFMVGENTETMRITPLGMKQGPFPRLPSGVQLVEFWVNHRSFDKCARAILLALIKHPAGLMAAELCKATVPQYEYSGGFKNALSDLRTAGVMIGRNTERMMPNEDLRRFAAEYQRRIRSQP